MITKKINLRSFLHYKFLNSLFLGVSVGSIFTLYAPLEPSVYSLGGIVLALGMLFVAKLYHKILTLGYFFGILALVEVVILLAVIYFLLFSYSYTSAFLFYASYQFTFIFGSYLMRAETLFLKKRELLSLVDVAKQKGYLAGMLLSYLFYQLLEFAFATTNKEEQVYAMHFLLLFVQMLILYFLVKSFKRNIE